MPQIEIMYDIFANHLQLLRSNDIIDVEGEYICPICLKPFAKKDLKSLSLEDAPQESLGGKKIAITCKSCNNRCGYKIDVHLVNAIDIKEQQDYVPGSHRNIRAVHEETTINAKLNVHKDNMELIVSEKNNNPLFVKSYVSGIKPNSIITIKDKSVKAQRVEYSTALLKNAYIILFSRFGYTFFWDKFYDILRQQILDPTSESIPFLWHLESLDLDDGIYFSEDYDSFCVIFTLKRLEKHQFCVFIPTPRISFDQLAAKLEAYEPGSPIKFICKVETDYLNNILNIKWLRDWVYAKRNIPLNITGVGAEIIIKYYLFCGDIRNNPSLRLRYLRLIH